MCLKGSIFKNDLGTGPTAIKSREKRNGHFLKMSIGTETCKYHLKYKVCPAKPVSSYSSTPISSPELLNFIIFSQNVLN